MGSLRGWWKVVQRQYVKVWKGAGERRYGSNTCSLWVRAGSYLVSFLLWLGWKVAEFFRSEM